MDSSTEIGGRGGVFPKTRWSVIKDATDPESPTFRDSVEHLASTYWRPVYAHFRRKWGKSNEEAKDLTQDFFSALHEKNVLERLSPGHGRFRSYVMAALDNFVRLQHRHESRLKRGGGAARFSLDIGEGFDPPSNGTPEEDFLRDWARSVLDEALREMEHEYRENGSEKAYKLFLLRDVNPPRDEDLSYEGLSKRFGLAVTDVTNYLFRARKYLRDKVLGKVRDTVTTQEEAESEMRELFAERVR